MIIDHFYLSILENLPQVILVATPLSDPETGQTDFLFEYVNPAWERVIGSPLHTIRGKKFSQTVYASSSIPWIEMAKQALQDEHGQQKTLYSEMLEKWLDVSTIPLTGSNMCVTISDVSELKTGEIRLKEQNYRLSCLSAELASSKNNLRQKLDNIENLNHNLEQLAYYDRLTQLPNRTRFTEILTDELEASRKAETNMALAVFDIDDLKILNDTLSHEAGDELIRQVAERLTAYTDHSIASSRFGGDEFLIIIRDYEHDAELLHIVDSIQKMISRPYLALGIEIKATVSIGVATYPDDSSNVKELLKFADIALSDAKKRGKNTLSLFHSVMQETLLSRIKMEKKILKAFEEEAFQVFYQPQYDVLSKTLRGFEALVRWFDDELGYIAPDTFIPIAEETQLIIPLGKWIMRTACKTLRDWQNTYGFTGTLNTAAILDPVMKWDMAHVPVGPTGVRKVLGTTDAWSAWSGTPHPDETWEVLKFLSGAVYQDKQIVRQEGIIPVLKSATTGFLDAVREVNPNLVDVRLETIPEILEWGYAEDTFWFKDQNAASEILVPALEKVYTVGDVGPEYFIEIADQVNASQAG